MELKLSSDVSSESFLIGSNRTFMELKSRPLGAAARRNAVLIVPLWN